MIVPPEVAAYLAEVSLLIVQLSDDVRARLLKYCEETGYAYLQRTKKLESIYEKLETGRVKSWDDLDDGVACSIIVPDLSHEATVLDYLGRTFDVVETRRRGETKKDPAVFRFDSSRVICRLKPRPGQSDEPKPPKFEVQVRTAFEHAWTVVTHDITYKGNGASWSDLRLAAQLKAMVEQLDISVLSREALARSVVSHGWHEIAAKAAIRTELDKLMSAGLIPAECQPQSWSRLVSNLYQLVGQTIPTGTRDRDEKIVDQVKDLVSKVVKRFGQGIPRSLSIFQVFLGMCACELAWKNDDSRYTPIITSAALEEFPQLAELRNRMRSRPVA